MCDCCDIPQLQPAVTEAAPLVTTTALTIPDPYTDIEAVALTDPQPTFTVPFYDPNAPTLADIEGQISTMTTNIIDPYPGYTADYNNFTNEVDWTPEP